MYYPVEQVLYRRVRLHRQRKTRATTVAAVLLHLVLLASALIFPLLGKAKAAPPRFVTAQVVPLQALGVQKPPPIERPRAETPPPKPREPEPSPPVQVAQPEKPAPRATEVPTAEKPPPAPVPAEPLPQAPPAPDPPVAARQGAEDGHRDGTDPFGAPTATLDNPDFTYGYYVKRMVALIRARWTRPLVPDETQSVVHFRILRDGTIEDLELREASGSESFDRSALRAVQAASPLPPLPVGYRQESLGVSLIVR